jgi:hypothetical protein
MSLVFRWVVGIGDYYIDGHKDGYPVEQEKIGQMVVRTSENQKYFVLSRTICCGPPGIAFGFNSTFLATTRNN